MALKTLTMEDFLGKTITHDLHPNKNRIRGKNGSGKTSIKEAICFLFTGTDSSGSRNPQHLISHDKDSTKVTLVTDKAELSRTLTRKGNGTIKLVRAGTSQQVTQTQMEQMIGSGDLFLSAFVPGYFLALSSEKQHKLISEISPKVDRGELIKTLAGFELTNEEKLRYSIDRRVDLVANGVAADRRDFERQMAVKEGEIKQLESLEPLPAPECAPECDKIPYLEDLRKSWETYESELRAYNNQVARYDRIKIENDLKEGKRKELKTRLESMKLLKVPAVKDQNEAITNLMAQKKQPPHPPAVGKIVEADHCSTCGQTVGKSHREHVRERNQQLISQYETELKEVNEHNNGIEKQIGELNVQMHDAREKRDKVVSENAKISSQMKAVEIELASQVDQELPHIASEKPQAPEEVFDQNALDALIQKKKEYASAIVRFDFVSGQIKDAETKVGVIKNDITTLTSAIDRLKKLEEAIKQIPQEELKKQMEAFEMKTVVITVGEKIEVRKDGILYDHLSTGQKAKADVELCQKLNALMPRPIHMIFLDNADLIDEIDWGNQQMFAAFVDKDSEHVQIEAIN